VQKAQPEFIALPIMDDGYSRQPLMYARKGETTLELENGKRYIGLPLSDKDKPLPSEKIIRAPNGKRYRAIGVSIERPVSIRQALWILKLYAVKGLKDARVLAYASYAYSIVEILSKIADIPFDTSELDTIIRQEKPEESLKSYLKIYDKNLLEKL